jgi:hypothetical protein
MPAAGGPTNQSGIFFQNCIAALHMGDMIDFTERPASCSIASVRIEAPEYVDDIVLTYEDGHREFIHAKENIALSNSADSAWRRLWRDFTAQWRRDFNRDQDALTLCCGSVADEIRALRDVCGRGVMGRAAGAESFEEWWADLNQEQQRLLNLYVFPNLAVKESEEGGEVVLEREETWRLLQRLKIELRPSEDIQHEALRWMPRSNFPPATLFDLLLGKTGRNARFRKRFERDALRRELQEDNNVVFEIAPSSSDLRAAFYSCSSVLRSHRNRIGRNGPHIPRAVTSQIARWARGEETERVEDHVAVLLDGAGMGKSVVLRDALEALEKEGVPVLGIKADSQLAGLSGGKALHECLGLPEPVERAVGRLAFSGPVVVLFDQVDALSLSMAHNDLALQAALQMVAALRRAPNVRVLLSCRTFDLHTNPSLQALQGQRRFTLDGLTSEDVQAALSGLGFEATRLSPVTLELLRVPLHLDLLALAIEEGSVTAQAIQNAGGLQTLQDLYTLLWNEIVVGQRLGESGAAERIQVLRVLCSSMEHEQQTSAPRTLFEMPETHALALAVRDLASRGILSGTPHEWSFLHQTFFDYCFSRFFVQDGRRLSEEMLAGPQGLFERPRMLNVLAYLRGTDRAAYTRELSHLFESPLLRIHLRELLHGWFGQLRAPGDDEWLLARQVLADPTSRKYFLHHAYGNPDWFEKLRPSHLPRLLRSEDAILDGEIVPYMEPFVAHVRTQQVLVEMVRPFLNHSEAWERRCVHLMSRVSEWHCPEAITFYEELLLKRDARGTDDGLLEHGLDDLARSAPQAALGIVSQLLERSLQKYRGEVEAFAVEEAQRREQLRDVPKPEPNSSEFFEGIRENSRRRAQRPKPFDHISDPSSGGGWRISDELLDTLVNANALAFLDALWPYFEGIVRASADAEWKLNLFEPPDDPLSYCADAFADCWDIRTSRGMLFSHSFGFVLIKPLTQALLQVARDDAEAWARFSAALKALPYSTPQHLLIDIYREEAPRLASQAAAFLLGDERRLDVGTQSFESRRLVRAIAPHLSPPERVALEARVMDYWELGRWARRSWREPWMLSMNGECQWLLLRAMGSKYLSEPGRRRLQELDRKFLEPKQRDPFEREQLVGGDMPEMPVTSWGGHVGSPIDAGVAAKMSDLDWLRAMSHYTGLVRHRDRKALRGGSDQLASHDLQPQVQAQPERFHRLALRHVPLNADQHYIHALVRGLAASHASASLLFDVVRRFASRPERELRSCIATALRERADELSPEMRQLLEEWIHAKPPQGETERFYSQPSQAENGTDSDTRANGPFMDYLNSTRGTAFAALMKYLSRHENAEHRWQWLAHMAGEPSEALRAGAIQELLPLMDNDPERAIGFFERLVDGHENLLRTHTAREFLYYGIARFPERVAPFISLLCGDSSANVARDGAQLECLLALRDDDHRERRISLLLSGSPAHRQGAAIIFAHNFFAASEAPASARESCIAGLRLLVNDSDLEVHKEVARAFESMGDEHVSEMSGFVEQYIASPAYASSSHACDEFLWRHSELRPEWALDQVAVAVEHREDGVGRRRLGGEPLVRLVLKLYTSHISSGEVKERAITLFGMLLERFPYDASTALQQWDEGRSYRQ